VEYIGENGELVLSNPTKKGKEAGKNFTFNKVFGPTATQGANDIEIKIYLLFNLFNCYKYS
jgi:hypothetical protein